MRLLFPDARFDGAPDIEQAVAGKDVVLDIRSADQASAVPKEAWAGCDAILVYNAVYLTADVADMAKRCRIVVRVGVGYDKIDVAAWGQRGIPVCNTPDYGTTDVADMALAMLLSLARGVVSFDEALRADPIGNWKFNLGPAMRRLRGTTFGVVGLGRIGVAAALRAQAFGMRIAFFDPYLPNGTELALNFHRARSLPELLAQSNVISIHAPLTDETRGMIDARAVAAMQPDSLLINTARGPICDLQALHDGLKSGRLAGIGLDVLPQEPPDAQAPLIRAWRAQEPWIKGRVLLSPHAAFYSAAAFEDMRRKSMETAMLFLRDGKLQNCVNSAWLKTVAGRIAAG